MLPYSLFFPPLSPSFVPFTPLLSPPPFSGIHIESTATVFGTALNYVAMRIFGVPAEDARMVRARTWLDARGGCVVTIIQTILTTFHDSY